MTDRDGGPAFPVSWDMDGDRVAVPGMTLRDWFAGQALKGMLASTDWMTGAFEVADKAGVEHHEAVSTMAYEMADAMLAAREEEPRGTEDELETLRRQAPLEES